MTDKEKENYIEPMTHIEPAKLEYEDRVDGRNARRKTVGDDKLLNVASIAASSITQAMFNGAVVGQAQLKFEQVSVTVTAGNPSGTTSVTTGSLIIGYRPTGNQDQLVDNISISGTTLTLTLAANATANNQFEITLLKT